MFVLVVTTIVCVLVTLYAIFYLFPEPFFRWALSAQAKAAGLERREMEIDKHTVPYLVGGSGEPLVLLHGFGADKHHWPLVAKKLAQHFTVYAPDIPGFGESSRIKSANYSASEQISRIHQFIQSLGVGKVHLGGNSMGGYLAGLYASRHPEDVASLWLLAPAGVVSAEPSELAGMMEQAHNPLLVDSRDDYNKLVKMCFTKVPYIPGPFQRLVCARAMEQRDFNAKIFEDLFAEPHALEEVLAGSNIPTLIVWGDEDRILHCSGAKILAAAMAQAEATVMDKMGHIPMVERPDETGDLFLSFRRLN